MSALRDAVVDTLVQACEGCQDTVARHEREADAVLRALSEWFADPTTAVAVAGDRNQDFERREWEARQALGALCALVGP